MSGMTTSMRPLRECLIGLRAFNPWATVEASLLENLGLALRKRHLLAVTIWIDGELIIIA